MNYDNNKEIYHLPIIIYANYHIIILTKINLISLFAFIKTQLQNVCLYPLTI